MPAAASDPLDALFVIVAVILGAGFVIVIGGGAFQAWRSWSDNRRIRKHLRN
jgi:hypothetical protein